MLNVFTMYTIDVNHVNQTAVEISFIVVVLESDKQNAVFTGYCGKLGKLRSFRQGRCYVTTDGRLQLHLEEYHRA